MTKGERIKKLRKSKGITQIELAKRLKTTKQTVSKYEKGIVTNIPSDRLEDMAFILGTTPEYILGWDVSTEEDKKNSDAIADITKALFFDENLLSVVSLLCKANLDESKLNSVKEYVEFQMKR